MESAVRFTGVIDIAKRSLRFKLSPVVEVESIAANVLFIVDDQPMDFANTGSVDDAFGGE